MKTKKLNYTKRFILTGVIALSIFTTACGNSTPPPESPVEISLNNQIVYTGKMIELSKDTQADLSALDDLNQRSDRGTDSWFEDVVDIMKSIQRNSADTIAIDAPMEYEEFHKLSKEAAQYRIKYADSFLDSYKTLDLEMAERAAEYLQLSRIKTQQANDVLKGMD